MNKFGMHGPNHDPTEIPLMLSMGLDNYTVVDKWEQVSQIRAARPNALILIRPYFIGGMGIDPTIAARCACEHAEKFMPLTKHLVVGNELNIESPSFDSHNPDSWRQMNEWVLKTVEVARQLLPNAVIHFPAISPGVGDDPNVLNPPGLEYCREAVNACDILDQHVYWPSRHPERFEPWFGRRMLWHHGLFPNKYIFISECGPTDVVPEGTAQDVVEWFGILEAEFPYVLGGTLFMWNWGDSGPQFNYYDKPAIINALRDAMKVDFELPTSWEFGEEEPVEFDVDKCGEWLRNELWNALGVPYNPAAAFPVHARALGWGRPLAPEGRREWHGHLIAYQPFALGFLFCREHDWANIQAWRW